MEIYLLKSNLSLFVLYALYRAVLQYEYNHQLNRFLGLTFLIFSSVLLLIPMGGSMSIYAYPENVYTFVQRANDVQAKFSQVANGNSMSIYLIIYALGVGVFSIRSLFGLGTLFYYYLRADKYHRWGFKVFVLEKDISPFTFFNILFIGHQRLNDKNRNVMLVHEQLHRDQFHSIDTLILEILTIVFWFNPFIWLFQRDIKAEHEFLADEHVLEKGFDKLEYQQMLFKSRTGISFQFGNYLSKKTSLSKRFKMMKNKKTNVKMTYIRVIAALSVMVLMMVVSSFSEIGRGQLDQPAVYKKGIASMYQTIGDEINYPTSARNENRSGMVYISFTVNKKGDVQDVVAKKKKGSLLDEIVGVGYSKSTDQAKGVNKVIQSEAIRVVEELGKFTPAQNKGKAVRSTLILPIQFRLSQEYP